MPCRSYEDDDNDRIERQTKKQLDRLARIACKAMTELEKNGIEDFLLLEDDEVREWWTAHKEADRKERERKKKLEEEKRIKIEEAKKRKEILSRLTAEEQRLLGVK